MKKSMVHPQFKLYQLIDKVANNTLGVFTFKSDAECVRSLFPTYYPIMPLRDMEIRRIGFIDFNNDIVLEPFNLVGWDCYKLPESHAENLKEIGMTDEQVKNLFKQRIDQSSTDVKPVLDFDKAKSDGLIVEELDVKEIKVKDSE